MTRWIAFDQESAAALAAVAHAKPELRDRGDAFTAALGSAKDSVVLLPARTPGQAVVAHIRYAPVRVGESPIRAVAYEASGFLGLSDAPIFEEEPAPPKKWWQKILE